VSLICAAGHACSPRPNSLQQGQGICHECLVAFDRVYLLHHPETGAVKIGVASGDARVRQLCDQGYVLVAHWLGLAHSVAVATERTVLKSWRGAGVEHVQEAPRSGRTETAPAAHLWPTYRRLHDLLGAPDLV
jgi:hypothetical protein